MRTKATIGIMAIALCCGAAMAGEAVVGQPAPDFTLTDIDGASHTLSGLRGKVVVLEWTNYDCPFVKKHYGTDNMQSIQKQYTEQGVVWFSICSSAPGKQGNYPAEKWPDLMKEKDSAPTAVLLDADGVVGRLYGAKTTPHMFVVDAGGVLVYAGAIDDNAAADPSTVEGAHNYVRAALDAVKAGQPVEKASTQPYGCSVKY